MGVNKPRNRTLIFRLSEDEYECLQAASSGARSLSDFARERLMRAIKRPPIDEQLAELRLLLVTLLHKN
jgi:hypothetical protein